MARYGKHVLYVFHDNLQSSTQIVKTLKMRSRSGWVVCGWGLRLSPAERKREKKMHIYIYVYIYIYIYVVMYSSCCAFSSFF